VDDALNGQDVKGDLESRTGGLEDQQSSTDRIDLSGGS